MPPCASSSRILKTYKSRLDKTSKLLICPLCKDSLRYTHFESHCQAKHHLNPRRQCVWCLGDFSWPSKQKHVHIHHIIVCFEHFKRKQARPAETFPNPSLPPSILTLIDSRDQDSSPFDHDVAHLPPRAHDVPFPAVLEAVPLTFQDDALNLAASCVRKFLTEDFEWFHVSVRIPAYTRFLEVVETEGVEILPFTCWCDAGDMKEARFRQHRHLIVGCSIPDYFKRIVWPKAWLLRYEKPHSRYRPMHLTTIRDAWHFVNTILYVSQRQSQCAFSGDRGKRRDNHFYLAHSLSKACRLPLVLMWKGGLRQQLNKQCKNLERKALVHSEHLYRNVMQWQMRIEHIPDLPLGLVLPVDRIFEPCSYPTAFKLHLLDGEAMYFDRNEAMLALDLEEWTRRQAERGNAFYHVVGEKIWTPRPYQQGYITDFKPLVDRNRELESEIRDLKSKLKGSGNDENV